MSEGAPTEILSALEDALGRVLEPIAQACSIDGKIDSERTDNWQAALYDLAVTYAELRAARVLATKWAELSVTDRQLAQIFTREAAVAALDRLEGAHADTGLPFDPLFALRAFPAMTELRVNCRYDQVLGSLIAAGFDDYGQVALAEDTNLAAEAFRRLATEVVAPQAERIHRESLTVPESVLQPMRDMGVFGLTIPARYGGSAGETDDTPLMLAVTEALSEASLAAAGSLITRPEILTRALLAGGTEAQKTHWLPRIAAGDPLAAIAITEPDYGSDVASLMLRATRTQDGWLLDGAKTWCTFAGKAGLLMVVARTDLDRGKGHRGLSAMLVEKPSYEGHEFCFQQAGGGVLTGRAIPTPGYRGMHSFDLAFDRVFVPDANVIGEEAGLGRGFYLTMAGLTGGRIQTAGRALGVMRAAIDAAVAYVGNRRVFGAPLADYQLTRVKLARMAARYAACRRFAYAVARELDAESRGGGDSAGASLAKLIACRAAEWVTREAMQLHGGMGYAEESAVSRYWLDARVLSIFEGAEETLALKVIARRLLEDALQTGRPM
ncbi:MAG: acyl-CoA dehydrogenase family protein [Qipengyuania sp.]|nr:acyl-CoA dehydrogenase family protein [Qipengyuania sp.]